GARLRSRSRPAQLVQQLLRLGDEPATEPKQLPAAAPHLTPENGRADAGEQRRTHAGRDVRVRQEALFAGDDNARADRAERARVQLRQFLDQPGLRAAVRLRLEELHLRPDGPY